MSLPSLATETIRGLIGIILEQLRKKNLQGALDAAEELAGRLGFEEFQRTKTPAKKTTKKSGK